MLNGDVLGQQVEFLVDSGASYNFVSSSVLKRLGLVSLIGARVRVRLADRRTVETDQFIKVVVNFQGVQAFLQFTVLDVQCPNILGLPFLEELNPVIDWKKKRVVFPKVVCDRQKGVVTSNMFAGLDVDEVEQSSGVVHDSHVPQLEPIGQATPGGV